MAKITPGDHNPDPDNSTFARRAARRAGTPAAPRRRLTLRAGADAEQEFTITGEESADRVRPLNI